MTETWTESQIEEREFWGDCRNTFGEELKQQLYMRCMGFSPMPSTYGFDMKGRSVLDVGGGPCSVLLKCVDLKRGCVVEPCAYPAWVWMRYHTARIDYVRIAAEEMDEASPGYDVGLMYNVLQHVQDPERIVKKLIEASGETHAFEWIDIPPHPGHPHMLTASLLDRWFGKSGTTRVFHGENECYGKAWYL
jgi:2-polyprenyl-3-methyl-5-hydroxy-6-metoxy-1,4-benzoquinol methylase